MATLGELADKVFALGETMSPLLSGTPVGAIVSIGTAVLDLIEKTKQVVGSDDAAMLEGMRQNLEPLVLAHAKRVSEELRGTEP